MTIALFGGRFDPIHNGHLAVARAVLKQDSIDEVWFVPDNVHQWNPIIAYAEDRLKMLELVLFSKRTKLSDIAIRLGGKTRTIDVIDALQMKFTQRLNFIFICGSDQIPDFPKWTGWERLEKEMQFLIIPRKGYPITDFPQNCRVLSDTRYDPLDDSSRKIRERIKTGLSIRALVPKQVEEYIMEKKLYK